MSLKKQYFCLPPFILAFIKQKYYLWNPGWPKTLNINSDLMSDSKKNILFVFLYSKY